MARPKKITWEVVFKDFKANHPKYAKQALRYIPHSYATILITFSDGTRMTYDYDTKELTKIYTYI